jgi:predicted phosphoribosyltransferase
MKLFRDRHAAGKVLARELGKYRARADVVVVAVRNSGTAVAEEIAEELEVRLDQNASPDSSTVILVDDGASTGAAMREAIRALKRTRSIRVVAAVPVASSDACEILSREADEVICTAIAEPFSSVNECYSMAA